MTQIWVLSHSENWSFRKTMQIPKMTTISLKMVLGIKKLSFWMKILKEIWDSLPEIHAFASLKMVVILWICSIWPKDHRTVIFFSAWIKAQIWVKWLSYFFYKSYHRLCEEDWFCTAEDSCFCLSAKQSNLKFVKIVVTEIFLPKRKEIFC